MFSFLTNLDLAWFTVMVTSLLPCYSIRKSGRTSTVMIGASSYLAPLAIISVILITKLLPLYIIIYVPSPSSHQLELIMIAAALDKIGNHICNEMGVLSIAFTTSGDNIR